MRRHQNFLRSSFHDERRKQTLLGERPDPQGCSCWEKFLDFQLCSTSSGVVTHSHRFCSLLGSFFTSFHSIHSLTSIVRNWVVFLEQADLPKPKFTREEEYSSLDSSRREMMCTGHLGSAQGGQRYDQGIILKKLILSAVIEGLEVTETGEIVINSCHAHAMWSMWSCDHF